MILGYNAFLGYMPLQGGSFMPTPSAYTGLKVFGECIIDNIRVSNYTMTDAEIGLIDFNITPPWVAGKTIFLATFDYSNLVGGNVIGLLSPILNWVVQRKKTTDITFTTLATLPVGSISYVDSTAEPNTSYTYQLLATNETEISEPLVNTIDSDFYNSIIMDVDGTDVYIFDANLDFSGFSNEVATQRYDGYNKYSAYAFGNRDFKTGDVSAIIHSGITGSITQTIDYVKAFNEFINNGKQKIFKDRKGNVLKVVTTGGVKQVPVDLAIGEQPYMVSFHFEEVAEVN